MALTRKDNTRPIQIKHMRYAHEDIEAQGPGSQYTQHAHRGAAAARAAVKLRDDHGYTPDVIFGHPGWGETLFLREVWPAARMLTYGEFYYGTEGRDWGFDPEFSSDHILSRANLVGRQAHLLHALQMSDAVLSPTHWQASTFPAEYRNRITVIHDGVDTDVARPDPKAVLTLKDGTEFKAGQETLTYVSRNLEPCRGYHIFMRALPAVLKARPEARVLIVGGDGTSYGPSLSSGESWKDFFLREVADDLDVSRVHFTGKLPFKDYIKTLQVSRVHAYLTYPFVLSWSLMEALSAGCHVVASDTAPLQEVIMDGRNGNLVPFFDVPGWSAALAGALADPEAAKPMRTAARAGAKQKYDLKTVSLPKLVGFVEGAAGK